MRSLAIHAVSAAALLAVSMPASAYVLSGTYYEDSVNLPSSCNNFTGCTAQFPLPAATAGKILNLRSISCFGTLTGALIRGHFFLTDGQEAGNDINPRRYQGLAMPGRGPGQFSWREQVDIKVGGGPPRVINIFMLKDFGGGSWGASCTITGELSSQ